MGAGLESNGFDCGFRLVDGSDGGAEKINFTRINFFLPLVPS